MAPSAVDIVAPDAKKAASGNPIDPSILHRLDQDFVDYYNALLAPKPATHNVSLAEIRANPRYYASPWQNDFIYEDFVRDIQITSDDGHVFTARCYYPDPRTSPHGEGPYPVHVNFHGGGFVFGDLTGDAELNKLVRDRVGILVIDVNYRLAPENMYLKGHDDAWAAVRWVHEMGQTINAKADSISVGGISAGGHISAVIQQLARDSSIKLKTAILAVPVTACFLEYQKASDSPFESYVTNQYAPNLNWKRMAYFRDRINESVKEGLSRPNFWHSPLEGNLSGVCRSFIATADCDPLRDEGEEYGRRLVAAGVTVTSRRYLGVPHPFMHILTLEKAREYARDVCAELRIAHGQ